MERKRRMDEQVCLPGSRDDGAARAGARLQGACDRGPDRPDAPSRLPPLIDGRRCCFAHIEVFGVHAVVRNVALLHGLERPRADVQIEFRHGDAFGPDAREQLRCEVQPGRGRGDAAVVCRVDGLVALPILGARRPPDVGGERHFPVLRERCTRIQRSHETHAPEPPTHATDDLSRAVVAEGHAPSRLELAARMSHRDPAAVGQLADE